MCEYNAAMNPESCNPSDQLHEIYEHKSAAD